jgi:hypothetical protein
VSTFRVVDFRISDRGARYFEPEPINEEDAAWQRHAKQENRDRHRRGLEREVAGAQLLADGLATSAAGWRAKAEEIARRLGPANARIGLDEAERQEARRERTVVRISLIKSEIDRVRKS